MKSVPTLSMGDVTFSCSEQASKVVIRLARRFPKVDLLAENFLNPLGDKRFLTSFPVQPVRSQALSRCALKLFKPSVLVLQPATGGLRKEKECFVAWGALYNRRSHQAQDADDQAWRVMSPGQRWTRFAICSDRFLRPHLFLKPCDRCSVC